MTAISMMGRNVCGAAEATGCRDDPEAITLGLGANILDDQELLQMALIIYDALYTWCRSLSGERHGWHPQLILRQMRT